MNEDLAKLLIAGVLFAAWIAFSYWPPSNADELIGFIKAGLTGLSAHWLTVYQTPTTTQAPSFPRSSSTIT